MPPLFGGAAGLELPLTPSEALPAARSVATSAAAHTALSLQKKLAADLNDPLLMAAGSRVLGVS